MQLLSSRKLFAFNSIVLLANSIIFCWLAVVIPEQISNMSIRASAANAETIEGIAGEVLYNNEGIVLAVERREPAIGFPQNVMLAVPAHALRCDIGEYQSTRLQGLGYQEFSIALGLNYQTYAVYTSNGYSSPKVRQWQTTIANTSYVDRNADGEWDMRVTTEHAGSADTLQTKDEYIWLEGMWKITGKSLSVNDKILGDGRRVKYDSSDGKWAVQKLNNEEPTSEE